MALRKSGKPNIKMVDGYWVPEYSYAAADPLTPQRNQQAWAFCANYATRKQMLERLEARGICSKR